MPKLEIGIKTAQTRHLREEGQIHVYDGYGKGKSQAALGVVLRTIGLGIAKPEQYGRVLLLRFLKGEGIEYDEDGAILALKQAYPHLIDQIRLGRCEYFDYNEIKEEDRREARRGWDIARGAITSGLYSVIVLDELNPVIDLGLLSIKEVMEVLDNKPKHLEIIITGRDTHQDILAIAGLHSEMKWSEDLDRTVLNKSKNLYSRNYIEIYHGSGKGKSTSALGKGLQEIGRSIQHPELNGKVFIMQWLKGGTGYTEDAAIAALQKAYPSHIDHYRCGRDAIVWYNDRQPQDYKEAERGWLLAKQAIMSGWFSSVILDELNPTVDLELLNQHDVYDVLINKPPNTQVIITGRCKNIPDYFGLADVISEVYCHKHYANYGIDLQQGIDF
jgi:cob(I)alamin adenosyltransferase